MAKIIFKESFHWAKNALHKGDGSRVMEFKPPAAGSIEKTHMSIVSEFASVFLHRVAGSGRTDDSPLKEFTWAVDKGVGDGKAGQLWGRSESTKSSVPSSGLAVGSILETPCKQEAEAPGGQWCLAKKAYGIATCKGTRVLTGSGRNGSSLVSWPAAIPR